MKHWLSDNQNSSTFWENSVQEQFLRIGPDLLEYQSSPLQNPGSITGSRQYELNIIFFAADTLPTGSIACTLLGKDKWTSTETAKN